MKKWPKLIMLIFVAVAVVKGDQLFAMSRRDAFAMSVMYVRKGTEISTLVCRKKYDEARSAWKDARKRLLSNYDAIEQARQEFLLIGHSNAAKLIDDALCDAWTTNCIPGTTVIYRDVLADPLFVDRYFKPYNKFGLGDEVFSVIQNAVHIYQDSDEFLLLEFVPLLDNGFLRAGKVVYRGGGFVGRNFNYDKRRSEIARYVWSQREKYRKLFEDMYSAGSFLQFFYESMDNRNVYLDELKKAEARLAVIVREKGCPIKLGAPEDARKFLPEKKREWNYRNVVRGTVKTVIDGDTFVLQSSNVREDVIVRLAKIDAPELGQQFGKEAREYLSTLISGMYITVTVGYDKTDGYGRVLGSVYTGGDIDVYVNLRMVADGFAWHYKEYDSSDDFADAEFDAKSWGMNLWSDSARIRPSEWRKKNALTDTDILRSYGR